MMKWSSYNMNYSNRHVPGSASFVGLATTFSPKLNPKYLGKKFVPGPTTLLIHVNVLLEHVFCFFDN